jgi:hypothetical protein
MSFMQMLLDAERRWLGPSEYTGHFLLESPPTSQLEAALAKLDAARSFSDVPGLRSLRARIVGYKARRVCLELSCHGNVLDVLDDLAAEPPPVLKAVLSHCHGYPSSERPEAWLRFFRKQRVGGPRSLTRPGAQTVNVEQTALPGLPLTRFELALDDEESVLRLTMLLHRARARRDARARARQRKRPSGLRGVHAKHHGLAQALFRVRCDVPPELRQGILVPGAEYDAWVRLSNGAATQRPDWLPDVRGLAIKLLGVHGPRLLERSIPDGLPIPDGSTQDFALVTHPTFFLRDAREYVILRSLLDARPESASEWLSLLGAATVYGVRRPRELSILARTLLRCCSHPLLAEYHSLAAFQLGPDLAVKWSVRPTAATTRALRAETWLESLRAFVAAPNDYLKSALQRSLAMPLELEVALHIPAATVLPVEDPTIDWDKRGALRVVVASLTIAAQDATSDKRLAKAQDMVVSPWGHSLAAHRPLGSLNRARLGAYLASAQERWRANGVATHEPEVAVARRAYTN